MAAAKVVKIYFEISRYIFFEYWQKNCFFINLTGKRREKRCNTLRLAPESGYRALSMDKTQVLFAAERNKEYVSGIFVLKARHAFAAGSAGQLRGNRQEHCLLINLFHAVKDLVANYFSYYNKYSTIKMLCSFFFPGKKIGTAFYKSDPVKVFEKI